MSLVLEVYGKTDIGQRKNNEDVWASLLDHKFFAIADGIGGHKAGEVAAKNAATFLSNCAQGLSILADVKKPSIREMEVFFHFFFKKTNQFIYQMSKESPDLTGMGTTLSCLYFYNDNAIFGHAGDSRIYRLRDRKLEQLTKDHSLVDKKDKFNVKRNVITKAIGTSPYLEPFIASSKIVKNDIFLLCTDGFSDHVNEESIVHTLTAENVSMSLKVENLIYQSKKNGSVDNITIGVIEVKDFQQI